MEEIIFFKNEEEFYSWLEENSKLISEQWLGFYKKGNKNNGITWSQSVDAALCFGWIDGIRKSIDDSTYKIRFTPRKINSVWSAINVKKVDHLIQLGKMKKEGLRLYNNRKDKAGYSASDRQVELREDYLDQIKENQKAWLFYNNLAPSYKRDSIWWIMTAKKEETRIRRLCILISSSEQGLKIPILR